MGGVTKGAFGEAEAEAKFEAWKNNKQSGLAALKAKDEEAKKAEAKARLKRKLLKKQKKLLPKHLLKKQQKLPQPKLLLNNSKHSTITKNGIKTIKSSPVMPEGIFY